MRGVKNYQKGFTIVELLMVIGIISVLIGITVSAVSGSMKQSRAQKASALCLLVEQGMATYYAQKDEWPLDKLNSNDIDLNSDETGDKKVKIKTAYRFDDDEVRSAILELVKMTQKGNPVMDVSGLFVARKSGDSSNRYGMDFMSAVRGTKRNPQGIRLNEMTFGYPDRETGKFRVFKMVYSPDTDRVSVSKQD